MSRLAMPVRVGLLLNVVSSVLWAGSLDAQQIHGRITDRLSGTGLDEVSIQLVNESGAVLKIVVSDREGWYQLGPPAPGRYGLFIRRFGYHPEAHGPLSFSGTDSLRIDVALEPNPFQIDSLRVEAERRGLEEGRFGFERRCSEPGSYCFSPDSILRTRPRFVSDVIRLGVSEMIVSYPRGLTPGFRPVNHWPCVKIFVDHQVEPIPDLDSLGVGDIAAIEVYMSFKKTPLELRSGLRGPRVWPEAPIEGRPMVPYPCGMIQVWTKVGW